MDEYVEEYINYEPPKTPPKELFYDAFYNLMKEKPLDKIGVDEISERAGLSRRTFYRHFKSTESLLMYIFQKRIDFFISCYSKKRPVDFQSMVAASFGHWNCFDKQFLYILKSNGKLDRFLQCFLSRTIDLFAADMESEEKRSGYAAYVPYFITGGLCGILVKWLEDGANIVPRHMSRVATLVKKSDWLEK